MSDRYNEAADKAVELRVAIFGLAMDPEVRSEMCASLNFIASQLMSTGASVRRRAQREAEAARTELGPRVATAVVATAYPLCISSPAQLDGLACVDCNRPASDGPMVPLFEGSGLFRCSDELGCLPQKLVP